MKATKTHAGACGSWVLTVVGLLAAAAHGTALVHGHPDTRDVRFHEFKEVGIRVFVTGGIGGVHRHGENMISIITCQYAWPTIFILISQAWLNFWYQVLLLCFSDLETMGAFTIVAIMMQLSETKIESMKEVKTVNKESFSSSPVMHFPPLRSSGTPTSCKS